MPQIASAVINFDEIIIDNMTLNPLLSLDINFYYYETFIWSLKYVFRTQQHFIAEIT